MLLNKNKVLGYLHLGEVPNASLRNIKRPLGLRANVERGSSSPTSSILAPPPPSLHLVFRRISFTSTVGNRQRCRYPGQDPHCAGPQAGRRKYQLQHGHHGLRRFYLRLLGRSRRGQGYGRGYG